MAAAAAARRIVIAEDEAIIRLDLKEMLEEEGYVVVGETGRGDEVVDLVRALEPEVAILDVKMPGLDGMTAARQIGADRLAAVVILTAFSQRDQIDAARSAGVMSYVVKPFQPHDVVAAVEMAAGRFADLVDLRERLAARGVIERAKGVLMSREGLDEDAAFAQLRKAAMDGRTTMRAVAEALLH